MKRNFLSFANNLVLLLSGIAMAFSGFLIQFKYHMGHHGGIDKLAEFWGINYSGWSAVHKISVVFLTVFMVIHSTQHWKWYKAVVRKRLFAKNKEVAILTVVFVLAALAGYIPWVISLLGGSELLRKIFMEIHDKLTLILFVCLVIHIARRLKWYVVAYTKLRKEAPSHS